MQPLRLSSVPTRGGIATTWLNESSAAGMGGADASADRLALPTVNEVWRPGQLVLLPPARGCPWWRRKAAAKAFGDA